MSQYMTIYVKHKDDYVSIYNYSRSTLFYRFCQDWLNYGHLNAFTGDQMAELCKDTDQAILEDREKIETLEEEKRELYKMITSSNSQVLFEKIADYTTYINECKQDIEDLIDLKRDLQFYIRMAGQLAFSGNNTNSVNHQLYIGWEWQNEDSVE